jgi:hypothetical protein
MFTDISIDLETLGTAPGSVILSIGAIAFNADDPSHRSLPPCLHRFDRAINLNSAVRAGLTIDPNTVIWWLTQSEAARRAMVSRQGDAAPIDAVLFAFQTFIEHYTVGAEHVRIWGNGSDFDNVLLAVAYAKVNMTPPWRFYNNRCLRTLRGEHPLVPRVQPVLAHDALSDAEAQAATLLAIKHQGVAFPETT